MLKRIACCVVALVGMMGCSASSGDDDSSGGGYTYLGPSSGGSGGSSSPAPSSGGTGALSSTGTGGSGGSNAAIATGTGGGGGSGGSTGGSGTAPATGGTAAAPGDKYTNPGTNPFVLATYDPLSTFGADVDTASYDIFRRDVQGGTLPEPASVRLEEYVNYFSYAYPAPDADAPDPFAIHLAAAPSLYDTGTLLFRVGIQGKLAPSERGPANLVFLIDVSGSMAASNKLPLVKVMLDEALDVLRPTDMVSIVTYAGSTAVRLEPTPVSENATIRAVIDGLEAGGSTAGASGIDLAYTQAEASFVEDGINHVVMCTDGDFNVGASSDDALLALIKQKRASGITLTTLGFGSGNLNDSMMEKVSDAGNGMYSVVSDEDQAVKYAHDRLLSTMIHIASDMKIQVEFNAERVLAYRLLGYEDRAIADDQFRDDTVDGGEVGAGHRVTALYEIVPSGGAVPAPDGAPALTDGVPYDGPVEVDGGDIALVKVRYKQPGAASSDEATEVSSSLDAQAVGASYRDLDADFRWAAGVATFAEILKHSPYASTAELPAIADIVASDPDASSGDKSEFATLFATAEGLLGAAK